MNYEYSILSAIINQPNILAAVNLTPDNFQDPTCRTIYQAINELVKTTPLDLVTLVNYLDNETGQSWIKSVGTIANTPHSPKHIQNYVSEVRENGSQAILRQICTDILYSDKRVDIAQITRSLMDLQNTDRNWLTSGHDSLMDAFQEIQDAYDGVNQGITTGFKSIDESLGGWHNSDLVVIGARPAMGKTALLLSLQRMCNERSLIISCEMSQKQVSKRLMSQQSGVGASRLRTPRKMEGIEWEKLSIGCAQLKDHAPYWVYDKPGATVHEIAQQARAAKHDHDIKIMFVDYIQIIRAQSDSRVNEIEEVTMGLKNIARELDIPVIALAQVNRQCEERQDKRPMMSDLKGSGSIEQESDVVGFLYRDFVYSQDNMKENEAELILSKNRHGPIGTIYLDWNPKTMTFTDNGGW
jgi:replicative DNA helicase